MIGAEGGSRTRTALQSTDFKSFEIGVTWSYETIRTSIYGPGGRQGIASSGFVSTQTATIFAGVAGILFTDPRRLPQGAV